MFATLKKLFNKPKASSRRNRGKKSLRMEQLESRAMLSWTSVPVTLGWPSTTNVSFNSNANSGTAVISNNEVDVYSFVAPRTGTYTFDAAKSGSQVDTIAGLFKWNGDRIAGNDDSGGTTNSQFTAALTKGTKYAYAITNYTGRSTGGYRWSITGPSLYISENLNKGGVVTFGSGKLSGNNLNLYVSGMNSSNFSKNTHKVEVFLLGADNKPIHSGAFMVSVKTGGTFVSGKGSDTHSFNFDLSSWDLRKVTNIRIQISQ
jgi:hypothetical protein